MPYTQYTLATLSAEIANTLSDTANTYWAATEIKYAIWEALREWSGITSYWRERGVFSVSSPTSTTFFTDLSQALPTLRARTITVDQIAREIQYHFFEPVTGIAGTGMTEQFTISEILEAIVRARNRFVLDTHLPLTVTPVFDLSSSPSADRFVLNDTTVYCHRIAWIDVNGAYYPVYRSDAWAMDAMGSSDWPQSSGRPVAFSQAETRPLEIQLYPPPATPGNLELVTAESAMLDTADAATTLALPDDFCHAVKYAAMADILTVDGEQTNAFVADYCEKRYQMIVQAALAHKSVVRVQVNARPVALVPLYSLDTLRPAWHSQSGRPDTAATAYDLLAFSPQPNGLYGVTADVARTAIVPTAATDALQVGPEDIDNILDYVQHYLSIKMGGNELRETLGLFDGFQRQAVQRNAILANQARYLVPLFGQPKWDQAKNPDVNDNRQQGVLTNA